VAVIYSWSFFLPTFEIIVDGKPVISPGHEAFLIGLFSPITPWFGGLQTFPCWLANPLLWLGIYWHVRRRTHRAIIAGVLATLLASMFFWPEKERHLLLVGYYVWLASFATFSALAAIYLGGEEVSVDK
jgi:hypothetical protein